MHILHKHTESTTIWVSDGFKIQTGQFKGVTTHHGVKNLHKLYCWGGFGRLDSADILPLLEGEGGCVLHFLFKVLLGGGLSGSGMWRDRSFYLQTIYLCFLRFLHG